MTTRWIETLVGMFIIIAVVAFVFLSLNVSGLTFSNSGDSYRVQAFFSNVSGLKPRADVTLAGVTVGSIESIVIDKQEGNARVTMRINENINFLPIDTSANILTAGLLGEKYIGLQLGAEEQTLSDGEFIVDTQSSVVLEDLIGQFLLNSGQ